MPCRSVWVNSFVTGEPSRFEYVCWTGSEDDGGGGGGGAVNTPPPSSAGSESGIDTGQPISIPGPIFDAGTTGDGTVVIAGGSADGSGGSSGAPAPTGMYPNPGWNSGGHSVTNVPPDWTGMVSFDLPDVQGAKQGGVAVGFAPVSALPTAGRNGYGHLRYGLVVTSAYVRVIHAGEVVQELDYVNDVRLEREVGATTDTVVALMYGRFVKWVVNGVTLFAGPFTMAENYALDATLYLANDAVDNPEFAEGGDWGTVEDGSLSGLMAGFEMTAEAASEAMLVLEMPAFAAQLSDREVWNLSGAQRGFVMDGGVGEGIVGTMGPFAMVAADIANYTPLVGTMRPFAMSAGMGQSDTSVPYSVLFASAPGFAMSMTFPPSASIDAKMRGFEMRASSEASYSDLRAPMRGFQFAAYGGELTPLVEILESIGTRIPVYPSAYLALVLLERIGGGVEAVGYATVTAEAMEAITPQDSATYTATLLESALELIGPGERVLVLSRRTNGGLADDGEAWVVNTRTKASSRYDQYGFNSFATVSGKQLGVRTDGVYLLQGEDDAGVPIKAGVHLGKHDFGTQQRKTVRAVYAGVSSTGALYLKVHDGCKEHIYRARGVDPKLRTQRFDPGRGIKASYLGFELVSDGTAFELDTVKFDVVASARRV